MNEEEFRNDAMGKDKSLGMLTVDEVLTTKGFEHLTREEAHEYIDCLVQFCMILYQLHTRKEENGLGGNEGYINKEAA
jgi:hypothetical protein